MNSFESFCKGNLNTVVDHILFQPHWKRKEQPRLHRLCMVKPRGSSKSTSHRKWEVGLMSFAQVFSIFNGPVIQFSLAGIWCGSDITRNSNENKPKRVLSLVLSVQDVLNMTDLKSLIKKQFCQSYFVFASLDG